MEKIVDITSRIIDIGGFSLQCPDCDKIAKFKAVRTVSGLAFFGFIVKSAHKGYFAVCPKCCQRFKLNAKKGRDLLLRKKVTIFGSDLSLLKEDYI